MSETNRWTREQLLVAFSLYCQMPFGKMHSRNPDIIQHAGLIGRSPDALAMKLTNIASLDPAITSTGRKGLTGASNADRDMWQEMHADWETFAVAAAQALITLGIPEEAEPSADDSLAANNDIDMIDYSGSNKIVQATVRIGQHFFRRSVLSAYDYRCCITGLALPRLLVASHIVPWRDDTQNRLNPRNGLCLSALHDQAFDTGLITIAEDLTVVISKQLYEEPCAYTVSSLLAYEGKAITLPAKFKPDAEFLDYHRSNIFES